MHLLAIVCLIGVSRNRHELRGRFSAGFSGALPLADPKICKDSKSSKASSNNAPRLDIHPECFSLPPGDIETKCLHYPATEAGICYVRAEKMIIDSRNVIYWNALRETDIVMLNTGLHHRTR